MKYQVQKALAKASKSPEGPLRNRGLWSTPQVLEGPYRPFYGLVGVGLLARLTSGWKPPRGEGIEGLLGVRICEVFHLCISPFLGSRPRDMQVLV